MEQHKTIKIFNNKVAGIIFIILNTIVIFIEALIILKLLPYNIIGGGRLENYSYTFITAFASIIILLIEIIFIIIVQKHNNNGKSNLFIKIALWIILSYLFINLIGNILSKTLFEKIFMGIICVVQIINIIIIINENKKYRSN
jgi:hypothetical protein